MYLSSRTVNKSTTRMVKLVEIIMHCVENVLNHLSVVIVLNFHVVERSSSSRSYVETYNEASKSVLSLSLSLLYVMLKNQ